MATALAQRGGTSPGKPARWAGRALCSGELTFRALRRPYPTGAETTPQRQTLSAFLKFALAMDWISAQLGKLAAWAVLAAALISAGNAFVRYGLDFSSNAWLEIQWYLFAGVFMLGVGYVMLKNAHVRIDFISSKLSKRTNAIIDAIGIVVFTIPLALIMINLGWPMFERAWTTGEMSQNAGGLIRWPAWALLPLGFTILLLQAVSELIKRVAFITGHRDEPFSVEEGKSEEERLAEELAAEAARHEQELAAAAAAAKVR
jgi:TRAP-type mannitol/chloroaromatic compound transport system permease small subunit